MYITSSVLCTWNKRRGKLFNRQTDYENKQALVMKQNLFIHFSNVNKLGWSKTLDSLFLGLQNIICSKVTNGG